MNKETDKNYKECNKKQDYRGRGHSAVTTVHESFKISLDCGNVKPWGALQSSNNFIKNVLLNCTLLYHRARH